MSTELTTHHDGINYMNADQFNHVQRVAVMLSKSSIVPTEYQNNVSNCVVAMEIAHRMNMTPTMVMQNLHIIHGRPSWRSEFVISALRSRAEYVKVKFERGEQDGGRCRVVVTDIDGDVLEGSWVSMKMAKSQGWTERKGSKWADMPDQMLMYRAAAFFARVHCPEILNGMRPSDEVEDIPEYRRESSAVQAINDELTDAIIIDEGDEVSADAADAPAPADDDDDIL